MNITKNNEIVRKLIINNFKNVEQLLQQPQQSNSRE